MTSPNGHRAERDGCGCPPWVRCVHFDGQILWLVDRAARDRDPNIAGCPKPGGTGYAIGQGRRVTPCDACGLHPALHLGPTGTSVLPNLLDADDEFDRRHIELVGRPPE